jgi:very-short-patch-repair endonuclease
MNYRSAAEIIGFNNDFFGQVSQSHPQLPLVQGIYDEAFVQEVPQRLPHPPAPPLLGERGETDDNASRASTYDDGTLHWNTADKIAYQKTKDFGREMRKNSTQAEDVLWQALRGRKLEDLKFRRQHSIGRFIVDFVNLENWLVIEVDGDVHLELEQAEYDGGRTHELRELGFKVLRFSNEQILNKLDSVLQSIKYTLTHSLSAEQAPPSPLGEGGRGGEAIVGHVELLFTEDGAPALQYDPSNGAYTTEPLPGLPPTHVLDYDESTLYLTLQLVEQAVQDGFRLQDIAVLCRRRDSSRRVAKFLKERGYVIISADSLSLEFAEVVNLLVAVFRVLNQPADTLARAEALLLVDKVVRRVAPTPDRARRIAELANDAHALPFFDELRAQGYDIRERETGNLGLYELTERLIGTFGLLGRNEESEYLFRFLDLTLEYSLRFGNNLNNFLAYWQIKKSALSINAPAGRDAITITTVHKAKGLAYGVVIVPFADWSLTPYRGTLLWGRLLEEEKPVPEMPEVAVVSQTQALTRTPLAGQYTEELEKTFLEGLNMLYVAFTRPRHRLYVISRRPKATKAAKESDAADTAEQAKTVAELLHRYLLATNQWDDERTAYILADAHNTVPPIKNRQQTTGDWQLTNLASTPWEERLRLRRHANTIFDFNDQQAQGDWNRKLHYALRRTILAIEVDRVAAQLVSEGLVSTRERPELVEKLHRVVENPQVAHYFSHAVEAETEREILVGGARRQDYKPDRIVFEPNLGSAPGRVTLLDFKIPPPEPQHRRQLQQYAELFRQLGYADVQCVLYYFGTEEVIKF